MKRELIEMPDYSLCIPKEEVRVVRDRRRTVVDFTTLLVVNGDLKVVKAHGVSKRWNGDLENADVGVLFAMGKALRRLSDKILNEAKGLMELNERDKREVLAKEVKRLLADLNRDILIEEGLINNGNKDTKALGAACTTCEPVGKPWQEVSTL